MIFGRRWFSRLWVNHKSVNSETRKCANWIWNSKFLQSSYGPVVIRNILTLQRQSDAADGNVNVVSSSSEISDFDITSSKISDFDIIAEARAIPGSIQRFNRANYQLMLIIRGISETYQCTSRPVRSRRCDARYKRSTWANSYASSDVHRFAPFEKTIICSALTTTRIRSSSIFSNW